MNAARGAKTKRYISPDSPVCVCRVGISLCVYVLHHVMCVLLVSGCHCQHTLTQHRENIKIKCDHFVFDASEQPTRKNNYSTVYAWQCRGSVALVAESSTQQSGVQRAQKTCRTDYSCNNTGHTAVTCISLAIQESYTHTAQPQITVHNCRRENSAQ